MFHSVSMARVPAHAPLILGHFKGARLDTRSRRLDPAGAVAVALDRPEATGELGRVVEAFPKDRSAPSRVIVVGLGDKARFEPGVLRAAAGAAARRLATTKDTRARIDLAGPIADAKADAEACGRCFGEGLGLLAWNTDQFKKEPPERTRLAVASDHRAFAGGLEVGLSLARSANFARTLSETPPNIATPSWMAEQARRLARDHHLGIKVFRGDDLDRERLTGLVNVGKASENQPCMIRLEYRPKGRARGGKPVVLIGKTMCYDSGGLSLKINNTMVGMKRDKDGGCAVLGAMHAIATAIRPRVPVVALLAAAENSISDEAYRPDDILTYRNGVTVEVTNTDAEGRLVLADALCWACEKEDPRYIVDLATLTGGVVVALGSTYCGMFCEDDRLRTKIERAAAESGERVWRLPMHDEYREMMKSPIADILNSNPNRKAHPIQGAAFLSYFVTDVPWCHLDIAGVHLSEADAGCFVKGSTGWGTRLLANLLENE